MTEVYNTNMKDQMLNLNLSQMTALSSRIIHALLGVTSLQGFLCSRGEMVNARVRSLKYDMLETIAPRLLVRNAGSNPVGSFFND